MSDLQHGVKLALLEGQLMSGEIERAAFLERASAIGIPRPEAVSKADKYLGIAANRAALQRNLKRIYDYIVIGAGASGS